MHHSNSQHMSVNNLLNMISRNIQHGVNNRQSKTSCAKRGKMSKKSHMSKRGHMSQSKCGRRVSRSRSRSGKSKMSCSKYSTKHSKGHTKSKRRVGCTSCGCSRNGTKTKVVAIYRRPNNGKMMLKMINLNRKNNNSTHEMRKKHSVHHKKHSTHHKKHKSHCNGYALRPHGMVHNNGNHQSKKVVRNIINKILSKKNMTKRHNLVSMMHSMMDKGTKHHHKKRNSNMMNSNLNSNLSMMNSNSNLSMMNSNSSMMSSSSFMSSNMNQPIRKSKKVQSYYTSHNNGNHHTERGRRIVDDSDLPFIKINKLNDGRLETLHVPRN